MNYPCNDYYGISAEFVSFYPKNKNIVVMKDTRGMFIAHHKDGYTDYECNCDSCKVVEIEYIHKLRNK